MHTFRMGIVAAIAATALSLLTVPAQATLVSFTLTGDITAAGNNNPFGVTTADVVTATGTFDNTGFTGLLDQATLLSLDITVGSESFTNSMDVNFGAGDITFSLGSFYSLDFNADDGVNGATADFDSFFTSFASDNGGGSTKDIAGTWISYSQVVVPVPAAVWLFGSGLLGLVGVARRKRAS